MTVWSVETYAPKWNCCNEGEGSGNQIPAEESTFLICPCLSARMVIFSHYLFIYSQKLYV